MEPSWKRASRQATVRFIASAKQAGIAIFVLTCAKAAILLKNMRSAFL